MSIFEKTNCLTRMKTLFLNILTSFLLVKFAFSMDLDEIKTKLENDSDKDFMDVAHYIQFDVIKRGKRTKDEMIKIAHILYEFRDQEVKTMMEGDDVVYRNGRGWVVDRMARLTSYEDSLPESSRNQYLPSGGRIDPLGNLTFDVIAQNEFLTWYEKKFLNSKSERKPRLPPERNLDDRIQREAPNHLKRDSAILKEAYEKKHINWLFIVAGFLLVGILALLFKVWMGKSAR